MKDLGRVFSAIFCLADGASRQGVDDAGAVVAKVRHLRVTEDYAGQRVDNFLIRELKGCQKTHVYRIIRSGEVRVNGGRVRAETKLSTGDEVRLPPVRVAESAMVPTAPGEFPHPVLWEDQHLLAVDKPAGVAVHGGSGISFGVIEQLRMARPQAPLLELVHRLDRDTSGVLLIAKTRAGLLGMHDTLRENRVTSVTWPPSRANG